MLQLPHGCTCSTPTVSPKNWETGGKALLKKKWRIFYYFRDPSQPADWQQKYPSGKFIPVKGMNEAKDLDERRQITRALLEQEISMLKAGYNPLLKTIVPVTTDLSNECVTENTPFIRALELALKSKKASDGVKVDLKSVIKYCKLAADQITARGKATFEMRLSDIPINQVLRKHIRMMLEGLPSVKTTWTDNTFNYYRAHLIILFKELKRQEAIEHSPMDDIEKLDWEAKMREGIDKDLRHKIDMHLRKRKQMRFRLFNRIFFHSSGRISELFRVKGKDVDLGLQVYRSKVLKGKKARTYNKTIKDIAVRYWKLALKNCGPDEYIFSTNLMPGPVAVSPKRISRRWQKYVKAPVEDGGLDIDIDFYDHKHSNSTEVVDISGAEVAAGNASHTSTAMVAKVYDLKRMSRKHAEIKKVSNHY